MTTIERAAAMRAAADGFRREGRRIGFVPTMGSLHEGHLTLVRLARSLTDVVVVSVFVNPAQFGPGEDFDSYPRDPAGDAALAAGAGADVLFLPPVPEMYPPQFATYVDVGDLTEHLEGRSRPGHFRGVATVVAKLLIIVQPHVAVFGQKDAQQTLVVRRLVRDLGFGVEIVTAPIVREPDGLAMSSRNARLTRDERAQAPALRRSLEAAVGRVAAGERESRAIIGAMREILMKVPSASIDYISVADAETLEEMPSLAKGRRALISLAVRFGRTRLIDNETVTVS